MASSGEQIPSNSCCRYCFSVWDKLLAGITSLIKNSFKRATMGGLNTYKITIEKHPDGYVAYPIGIKGIVVGEGDTYEEAIADVKSAIQFHIETFGREALEIDAISETFVAEVVV
jgi:predicted RNase H-like HicB family nuclease